MRIRTVRIRTNATSRLLLEADAKVSLLELVGVRGVALPKLCPEPGALLLVIVIGEAEELALQCGESRVGGAAGASSTPGSERWRRTGHQ